MWLRSRWKLVASSAGIFAVAGAGCAAVYPELQTPLRPVEGHPIEAAPKDLRWIAFKGATVPQETRDGRKWGGDLGRSAPDPYAVLFVNGKVLLKTPVQNGTLTPTWADGPAGNFRIRRNDHFRVELWDSKAFNDHPIGMKDIGSLDDVVDVTGEADVECDSGAHIVLAFEPPHALLGLGFYYELRLGDVYVTRVYEESPAGRAGMKPSDQIVALEGKPLDGMKSGQAKSILETPHPAGLPIKIRHNGGQEASMTLKEGAVFPLFSETGTVR
jgi:hypothetical protein